MPSVIQWLCDACYAEGTSSEGAPHVISLDGEEARVIFCDVHWDKIVGPVSTLMTEYGVKIDAPTSKRRPAPKSTTVALPAGLTPAQATSLLDAGRCIYSTQHGPYSNRASAVTHMRNAHGVTVEQLGLGRRGVPVSEVIRKWSDAPSLLDEHSPPIAASGEAPPPTGPLVAAAPTEAEAEVYPCPEGCGKVLKNRQALGSHRFQTHGVRGSSPASLEKYAQQDARHGDLSATGSD